MDEYWNHNAAYHRRILGLAARVHGDVLDVGCGDGLLLKKLAPVSASVTGIDPDRTSLERAARRLADEPDVTLRREDFASAGFDRQQFGLVTFVASLHHMDVAAALAKARDLLEPGGELLVVGCAARKSPARLGSAIHGEARQVDAPTAEPRESLAEIRLIASSRLPGARIRRGLYYRYVLRWTKPTPASAVRPA